MAIRFTERELDIMNVLWERGSATAAEVRSALAAEGLRLAHTTVQTMLRILEEKGYVSHADEGRAHRFRATVERAAAGESVVDRVIDKIFGGSAGMLATELVSRRLLDRDEIRDLRRLLDRQLRDAKAPTRRGGRGKRTEDEP